MHDHPTLPGLCLCEWQTDRVLIGNDDDDDGDGDDDGDDNDGDDDEANILDDCCDDPDVELSKRYKLSQVKSVCLCV